MRHVEHVGAEVGEDAQTVVAPGRVADVTSCSIAVEEFREVNPAEVSGIENLFEPGDVRLKPMVVSGVARSLSGMGKFEQLSNLGQRCEQRLFDQRMFSIGQKVPKDRELFLVRNANAGRIVQIRAAPLRFA